MNNTQKYGFLTAISMVVGIVIGSGIFFKADDILTATGGSVILGVLGFIVVGAGVLFGALVISQYAIHNPSEGGMVAYAQDAFSDKIAYLISWFLITVYFPSLVVILGYVTIIYLGILIGVSSTPFMIIGTFFVIALAFITNILSKQLGGYIQGISMIIKLIPLFIIGLVGVFFFEPSTTSQIPNDIVANKSFFAALISIAFAFDGWIVITSISKEIKDTKKTLPRALVVGIAIITFIYIFYFLGVTSLVEPGQIISQGDDYIYTASRAIFGEFGSTVMTLFIVISVYGGLNGMTLAYLRLPHALVHKKMMKNIMNIEKEDTKMGLSSGSIKFCIIFVAIFFILQILILTGVIFSKLPVPFDISSMPVTFNYIIYTGLYIMVFKVTKKKNISLIFYVVMASLISFIVIYGALQVNGLLYIIISLLFIVVGLPFYNKEKKVENV